MRRLITLLFLVVGLSMGYAANKYRVTTSGATSGSTAPFSLTYGLTYASDLDTLLIETGVYDATTNKTISFQNGKTIILKSYGNGRVVYTGAITAPTTQTSCGLVLDGITINRGNTYLFQGQSSTSYTPVMSILAFRNDTIVNLTSGLLQGSGTASTGTLSTIELTNCIIANCGSWASPAKFIEPKKLSPTTVTIKNCTFARFKAGDIYNAGYGTGAVLNFTFENNTLFKFSQNTASTPYCICTVGGTGDNAGTSIYSIKNNIIAETGITSGANGLPQLLRSPGPNSTTAVTYVTTKKNFILGLNSNKFNVSNYKTTTNPKQIDSVGNYINSAAYNLYDPNVGFADTTYTSKKITVGTSSGTTQISIGNFTIKNSSALATMGVFSDATTGQFLGDMRWYTSAITLSATTLNGFNYVYNNASSGPSAEQSFTISAIALKSAITITAPSGYEISKTSGSGFASSVSLGSAYSNLSNTTIYVRLKSAQNVGSYSQSITVTATGISAQTIVCNGTITWPSASPLSTPSNLNSDSYSFTGFRATWDAVANDSCYTVKVYQAGTLKATYHNVTTAYQTITGLNPSTAYTFSVTAIPSVLNSSYSISSTATSGTISTANLNLFTSVNNATAGSVTPSSPTTYYSTSSTVQLTATKNFGYAFTQWSDSITGTLLSTANPYTVTMSDTKHIQAVFSPVATYNFTVNKSGDGATWGSVTASTAATGGKYETGTSVTLTPVSNLVSTFSQWENSSSTASRTITVSGDATYTATFTASPFICAWDFNPSEPRGSRSGDYYYNSSNKGLMKFYAVNGSLTNWGGSTISSKTCARRYTDLADMSSNCRSFVAVLSSKGYKDIQVKSKITYDNNLVHKTQKLQYSTDGTNYTDLTTIADLSAYTKSSWTSFDGSLPADANNADNIYIRWIGDPSSGYVGSVGTATTEGFYLTDVVISGATVSSDAASGDYVATTSGDISNAANWSISGGSFGISGNAASAPTTSTNLVIPVGITMTNSAAATCNQLKVRGTYSASADINAAGGIVLQSDSAGTGAILDNGNSITGTATVQQYLTGKTGTIIPRGWWYVSSPVSNAISGVFDPAGGTNKFGYWDETTCTYPQITDNVTALEAGHGYVFYNPGTDATISFSGILNTGNIRVPVSRTGTTNASRGFNLIGNPYPSYVNWNTVTKNNIRNTIWYRTWASGGGMTFDTFDGTVGTANGKRGAVSQNIPPMQGFWVKVNADGDTASVIFHNSDRVNIDPTLQNNRMRVPGSASILSGIIRLRVSNGINSDETILVTDAGALDAFDSFDSPKMKVNNPDIPEIYGMADSQEMVINHIPDFTADKTFTLGFRLGKTGDFDIRANEITQLSTGLKVILKDNQMNTETDLTDGTTYAFSSDETSTNTRFTLMLRTNGVVSKLSSTSLSEACVYGNVNRSISIKLSRVPVNCRVRVNNVAGQQLVDNMIHAEKTNVGKLNAGVYLVELSTPDARIIRKVILK